ncbi:MAG: FecR family protein [Spirochaetota bacterium]
MKRVATTLAIFLAMAAAVSAQSATVSEIAGKVEYRMGSAAWRPVAVGLEIPLDATISTGFDARAVLEVAGSRLRVGQLTRLTINELADDGSTVRTSVFVPVGRVRASVESPPARRSDFRIRTAQSTAAVRGTEFETNGWQILVSEGVVEFADLLGRSRNVSAQQISTITATGTTDPLDELNAQANIGDDGLPDDFDGSADSGYITVRWE